MTEVRLNAYHIMWLFVFFDLPVTTKQQRKEAAGFRKNLEKDGFFMMQFSVYTRFCASYETAAVHTKRVESFVPEHGKVSILTVTDKQYGMIRNFIGKSTKPPPPGKKQKKVIELSLPFELF